MYSGGLLNKFRGSALYLNARKEADVGNEGEGAGVVEFVGIGLFGEYVGVWGVGK